MRYMPQSYRIIDNLSLAPIPSNPQALFWFWTDRHSDLDLSWLAGVREISRRCPDLGIRTAHLSRERNKGPHVDGVPGVNLIWVHFGSGFFIGNEPVITRPGDIVLFERSVVHQVRARGEYIRTVVTTIARGHQAKYPRYLKDGIFYENFIPLEMPRSVADATLGDFSRERPRRENLFSASASK